MKTLEPLCTSYLLELLRSAVSQAYAQAQSLDEGGVFRCHRNRITTLVRSRLGVGLVCDLAPGYLGELFDVLETLEDVAHVGNGNFVPRESRLTMLADGWGRMSGGTPSELWAVSGAHIKEYFDGYTLGRVVSLDAPPKLPDEWEVAQSCFWMKATSQDIYARLMQSLSKEDCPAEEVCDFYNPWAGGKHRGRRWQKDFPKRAPFAVARRQGRPVAYFLVFPDTKSGWPKWIEFDVDVSGSCDEARKWILLSERLAETHNHISYIRHEDQLVVRTPDMFPAFTKKALFSSSSHFEVLPDGVWNLTIDPTMWGFVDKLFCANNCVLYEH